MTTSNTHRGLRVGVLFAAMAQVLWPSSAAAQATAVGTINSISGNGAGSTTVDTSVANTATITLGNSRTLINWQTLNVNSTQTLNYVFNNPTNLVVNRVLTGTTTLNGRVNGYLGAVGGAARGNVWFINTNGLIVGGNAVFNVGGTLFSTRDLTDADVLDGNANFNFSGAGTAGVTINSGAVVTAASGGIYGIGETVSSNGILTTSGTNALISGRNLTVTFDPNLSAITTLDVTTGSGASTGVTVGAGAQFSGTRTLLMGAGMVANTGNVLLQNPGGANDIRFNSGTVDLVSRDADVIVRGAFSAPTDLTISAGRNIDFSASAAGPTVGRNYSVTAQDFLGPALRPTLISSTGAFSITDTAGGISLGNVSANGNLSVTAQGGSITVTGPLQSTGGSISLDASTGGAIGLGGNLLAAQDVTLNATGNITQTGGAISAIGVTGFSGSTIFLSNANNFRTGFFDAGGDITVRSADAQGLTITYANTSSGAITLTSTNGLKLNGSTVRTLNGSVTLNGPVTVTGGNVVSAGLGTAQFSSTIDGPGALNVNAANASFNGNIGATSRLTSFGVSNTSTFGAAVTGVAANNIILDGDATSNNNTSLTLDAGSGMLNTRDVTATNANIVGRGNTIIMGRVTAGGPFFGGTASNPLRAIDLAATGGALSFAGGSAYQTNLVASGTIDVTGTMTTAHLTGNAGGAATLTGTNNIYALGDFTSNGLNLRTLQPLIVDGTVDTGTADARIDAVGTLQIASTGQVKGRDVVLTSNTFSNQSGSDGVVASGHWVIYQQSPPASPQYGGLDSGQTAIWGNTVNTLAPSSVSGNRYVFANTPTLTFSTINGTKVYGTDATGSTASYYTVTGFQPGVAGAYLGDTAATAFTGAPLVTSAGFGTRATVAGGPYAITIANGTVASTSGYALVFNSPGSLTVTPKALTGTATTTTKTYDGTTNGTGNVTLSGVVSGDSVGATATFTFDTKNAGLGKTVTVSGATLNGADAGNYTLTVPASTLGDILQKAISGTVTVAPKTYDGTTAGTGTVALSGVIGGDMVNGSATFTYADKNAGTGKTVTVSGATLTGADAGNYTLTLPASALGDILRKALTGTPTITTRTYDGTTGATGSIGLTGVVSGDAVGATAIFTFADKNAGTGKTVTITAATLTGADAGNYTLTVPASALGDILQKAITGTATVTTRTYDGTRNATGTIGLNGVVSGDAVGATGTFTFADKNAGTGKTVTVSGVTLNGADAGNYTLTVPGSALGDILQKSITGTATVASKTYDGTRNASGTIALNGVVSGDTVGATGTFTFADKNAGAGKLVTLSGVTLNGADAGNYTLSVPASALGDILQKAITGIATVTNKTYDGTRTGTGSIALNGVVQGDSVGATGTYTFSDANAGSGKTVTVGGVALTGADAGNYTVVVPGTTVADILRRAITVTANPLSKTQGSADPALTYAVTQGSLVSGDTLSGTLSRAAGEDPGTYAIGQGTLDASANYQLTFVGSTLTITAMASDPTAGVARTDDVGNVLRFLDGGADAAHDAAPLQIVDERRACPAGEERAPECEAGRPR